MANIMNQKEVRNKVHRNGFDLSFRNSFSAKVGELLPVMCKGVIPGDSFDIDLNSFCRTMPVKTAAFTRMKEYYDFYFVPMSLLWDKFDNYIVQTNNYNHARSLLSGPEAFNSGPYFTGSDLYKLLDVMSSSSTFYDVLGYQAFYKTCKLLEYLGYGRWSNYFNSSYVGSSGTHRPFPNEANLAYNPFPLLGYQKICDDYFRYDAWQSSRPNRFNLDYIFSDADLKLPIYDTYRSSLPSSLFATNNTILSLNYATYKKDLFMGLLPRAQFGDTAVAAPLIGGQRMALTQVNGVSGDINNGGLVTLSNNSATTTYNNGEGLGVSVFALRFAECTQKWREITQSGSLDFQSQIEKHWNVHASDFQSYKCKWLGGVGSNININEVANTNLAGSSDSSSFQAHLAGKGMSTSSKNGVVHFNSQGQYGLLYCIYHVEPILDWDSCGCDPLNLKVSASDYPIPEYDNLGMEAVPAAILANTPTPTRIRPSINDQSFVPNPSAPLGYAPRYYDYKISQDVVRGSFLSINRDWISVLRNGILMNITAETDIDNADRSLPSPQLNYKSFLINPNIVNTIFLTQADSYDNSDIFMNSVFFSIHAVRNLSRDGLPY